MKIKFWYGRGVTKLENMKTKSRCEEHFALDVCGGKHGSGEQNSLLFEKKSFDLETKLIYEDKQLRSPPPQVQKNIRENAREKKKCSGQKLLYTSVCSKFIWN